MPYKVTTLLLALTIVVYLGTLIFTVNLGGSWWVLWAPSSLTLYEWGAIDISSVFSGEFWRLGTSIFLHGNILHLGLNVWALYLIGHWVEDVFGGLGLLIIFMISALMGSTLSCVYGATLTVGASGGIFGCLFALVAWGFRATEHLSEAEGRWYRRVLGIGGLLNLAIGFFIPMVDNASHLGGTLMGMALGFVVPCIDNTEGK
jgi:rhomboid protease GluP